jgi:hypothetical protein
MVPVIVAHNRHIVCVRVTKALLPSKKSPQSSVLFFRIFQSSTALALAIIPSSSSPLLLLLLLLRVCHQTRE